MKSRSSEQVEKDVVNCAIQPQWNGIMTMENNNDGIQTFIHIFSTEDSTGT